MDCTVPSRIVLAGILIVAIAAPGILAARGVTRKRQEKPSPSVTVSPGTSGTQYVGRFSGSDSVTFGGNSSDYESGGRGTNFYDFYRFVHASGSQYRIQFAPQMYHKYHTITAAAPLTSSEGVAALIVERQAVPQIFEATDRVAYVNLTGTGKGYEGLAMQYADMPGTGSENFSRLVNSVELAK